MRHRGDVRNRAHLHAESLNGTDGRFTTRTGPFHDQIDFLDAHRLGSLDGLFRSQTGSEGCALA